jgi:pyruvate ferredoxin oxidoreductase gamma subunit
VDPLERRYAGTSCAAAAAQLTGVISRQNLEKAIWQELENLGEKIVQKNLEHAFEAFEALQEYHGIVKEGTVVDAGQYISPEWVELPFESADISAPSIHAAVTSEKSPTGLWRTMRPVIDYSKCVRCWWVCSTFCPDGAIQVTRGQYPQIDYDHCKGCMVCVSQCPPHAIGAVPEVEAAQLDIEEPPE